MADGAIPYVSRIRGLPVLGMLAALLSGGELIAQTGSPPEADDVHYGIVGQFHLNQALDFYRTPVATTAKTPAVVWVHGKGFWGGDESINVDVPPYSEWLAAGYSIVSVDYQHSGQTWDAFLLGTDAVYPGHAEDLALAVQFIRMRSDDWNIDPDKILLYGESAGGCLSSWLALSPDHAPFQGGVGHGAEYSTRVRGFVNYEGPTDWTYTNPFANPNTNHYFGVYFPNTPPFNVMVPLATQLEASSFWQATQPAVAEANRQVGAWQTFFGPIAGEIHDPYYGQKLQDALTSIDHGAAVLNWDDAPQWPLGPTFGEQEWMKTQFTGLPYGDGVGGTSPVSPELYLRTMGPGGTLMVTDAPPNAQVTFALGIGQIDVPLFGGRLYVQPLVFLYGLTNANGVCLRDLDLGIAAGMFDVFVQAAIVDPGANSGYALSGGLKLDLKE